MGGFAATAPGRAFVARCRDMERSRSLRPAAAEAAAVVTLAQLKGLIDAMSPIERAGAVDWLTDQHLDMPPYDRLFELLNARGRYSARPA